MLFEYKIPEIGVKISLSTSIDKIVTGVSKGCIPLVYGTLKSVVTSKNEAEMRELAEKLGGEIRDGYLVIPAIMCLDGSIMPLSLYRQLVRDIDDLAKLIERTGRKCELMHDDVIEFYRCGDVIVEEI